MNHINLNESGFRVLKALLVRFGGREKDATQDLHRSTVLALGHV